jgi:hypothetical protein
MPGKALQKMREELEAQKTKARKALANVRGKVSSPKAIIPFLLIGLIIGAILPRVLGMDSKDAAGAPVKSKFTRMYRRLARLVVGGVIFFLAYRKRHPIMWLGVGIMGAEVMASGIELVAPRLGITDMPEIGAGPAEAQALPAHDGTLDRRAEAEAQAMLARVLQAAEVPSGPHGSPELP